MNVRGRRRARTAALLASATVALLAMPTGAGASETAAGKAVPKDPAGPAGLMRPPSGAHGPVITHPAQEPVDYPAGEVCPFPAHAEFPVADLTLKTWFDEAGDPVFGIESGPLVMRVTNLDTGKTVTRDISGTGTLTYPDPDSMVLSGGDWGAGFHTSDRPVHNKWIISRGYMSVKLTTVEGKTSRRLLALHGPYEDLCQTLS